MSSQAASANASHGFQELEGALSRADTHEEVSAGDIAVGVIIGRSSEYFDFFVFGIACVLVFPALLFPFLSPLQGTLMSFGLLAAAFVGYRREGAWMQDDHLTLRRQKGFHLHCVCALHPDLCLTVQQSPWAVAAHRANLTLIFPGRLKQKVRSVALTELAFLQQAER